MPIKERKRKEKPTKDGRPATDCHLRKATREPSLPPDAIACYGGEIEP